MLIPATRRLLTIPFDGVLFHRRRLWIISLAILFLSASPYSVVARCKLSKAELPVTMSGSQPLISAKINGEDALFVADSGAFFSMISEPSAAQYKLRLSPAPLDLYVRGVGGTVSPSIATVKVFTIAGIPVHNVQFLVGGSSAGPSGSVGLLGQNLFSIGDVEYDLAKGTIRLMHADGCGHTLLAYWVKPSDPYSMMDIEWATPQFPHTTGFAFINGVKIRVMFDTGAGTSILSLKAAERAGVKPDSEGVVEAGYVGGIGRTQVKTYIGRFYNFKLGNDEEIHNPRIRFGDIGIQDADMLLGTDFFLSHRIYVASSQQRLYFTYNGGPVFNLSSASTPKASAEPGADTSSEAIKKPDEPADAAAYSRRGTAFAARRDFEHAIVDLTRACELAPDKSEYFYQRGVVYRDNKQTDLAAADFDRALALKPDEVSALTSRAQLRLSSRDIAGAAADLDAADRISPKEADVRLFLAHAYRSVDNLPASLAQYDLWIAAHDADSRMSEALNGRCWVRALQGQDLSKALSDCNSALKLSVKSSPANAHILDSRGLVRLRMGDYEKSIADYDASLQVTPKDAWSLYGRGIDKLRENKTPEGEADMADAVKLWPKIADEFTRRGIAP
jgi:tetratricopeptide (TPR) repeat protein